MTVPDKKTSARHGQDNAALEWPMTGAREIFLGFLLKRLGSRSDAEDVLQEFYIRVLARKDQIRNPERMDAWLYAVLRSVLNDHFRKQGRSRRLHDAVANEMNATALIQAPIEDVDVICRCVKGLVTELRPVDADLIRRIDIEEQNRAAVAADLGVAPGTLNVRLHRARAALGDALLAHCGPCCRDGFDDCSCSPIGCERPDERTHCGDTASSE
ncbi:RNA polymerase sigma factor [Nisaea sp.]|uniref:RNA polymerase sigma factor n=1 Tax=Nisaea sp. TaxID=2024842 RepID=UPI003B52C0DD